MNEIEKVCFDYYQKNNKKDLEFEVRFGKRSRNPILKNDVDNVIQKFQSRGFVISRRDEYRLSVVSEFMDQEGEFVQYSNIRNEIYGIDNIRRYCKSNAFQESSTFVQKRRIQNVDVQKFGIRYSFQQEKELSHDDNMVQNIINQWSDNKKMFRLINRMELTHPDIPIRLDISMVKMPKFNKAAKKYNYYHSVDESNVFNNKFNYEIELEFVKDQVSKVSFENLYKMLKQTIKYVLSAIQNTNFPISYDEIDDVMTEYKELIELKRNYVTPRDFIGPSSSTLQKLNIMDLENQREVSVLKKYTVTEKADGMRKLCYISKSGRIYLIDTNMKIEFTGMNSNNKQLFGSLFDGEHVPYSKTGTYINMYLAFDVYYMSGKDVREYPLVENDIDDSKKYRYIEMVKAFKDLKISPAISTYMYNMKFDVKQFYLSNEENNYTIFDACAYLLNHIKDGGFIYETDGIIFTPQDMGVGCEYESDKPKQFKASWSKSFKWKPPEFNTIDFFVETQKKNNEDVIKVKSKGGVSMSDPASSSEFKVLNLMVGYSPKRHGYINPLSTIINATYEDVDKNDRDQKYKAALFYPTSPYDQNAHICHLPYRISSNGEREMTAENGDVIEDKSIVEFKYVKENEEFSKWVPIRVRHDKTYEFRMNKNNFGNAYHVANSNWKSIHEPITEEMLMTGHDIFIEASDDDVYYNKIKGKNSETKIMRDFHNVYVKRLLINRFAEDNTKLIDFAVGKGGDFPKWIHSNINFVFGVDLSRDNIENKIDGVCARYLNYRKKYNKLPEVMFLHGDSSKQLFNGDGYFDERSLKIQNALIGKGDKDVVELGKGVFDLYGKCSKLFDVSSIQFALHYMFESQETLHNFIKNVCDFTRVGGHFIGTCFNGHRVFDFISQLGENEERSIYKNDTKIFGIKKRFAAQEFPNNASSLGYEILIYQETINQYISEYLVNFKYFIEVMEDYGFVPIQNPFIKQKKTSIGGFKELFDRCMYDHNMRDISKLSEEEKQISFMNEYFVFQKVRNVSISEVRSMYFGQTQEAAEE